MTFSSDNIYLDPTLVEAAKRLGQTLREKSVCLYITGLAASGKSSVAQALSSLTGIPIVDSGLVFRLGTYLCLRVPILAEDLGLFDKVLRAHEIRVIGGQYRVFSGDVDITEALRSSDVEQEVAKVASNPKRRLTILRYLRSSTIPPAIVAARGATEPITAGPMLQIELRADINVRVTRRARQSQEPATTVRKSIRARDLRDQCGPARYPSADFIDTTHLSFEASVAALVERSLERLRRLTAFHTFRRQDSPDIAATNPLLSRAWDIAEPYLNSAELKARVPVGQSRARFLLGLSRFGPGRLFGRNAHTGFDWAPGSFPPPLPVSDLSPNADLLRTEADRAAAERREAINRFLIETQLPPATMEAGAPTTLRVICGEVNIVADDATVIDTLDVRDASRELGNAIETHLHYLGVARDDTTHRIVLVRNSTDLPLLYLSIGPNTRNYMEALLWAFDLRMEEVAVAARGYGFPNCPRNGMAWFLRETCKRVAADFPHLKAIATDINPNWGFTGGSFIEAGFIPVGLKYAPTSFIGDQYFSRRGLDGQRGRSAATPNRLSLVPTLILLRPFDKTTKEQIETKVKSGVFVIPRTLYEDR